MEITTSAQAFDIGLDLASKTARKELNPCHQFLLLYSYPTASLYLAMHGGFSGPPHSRDWSSHSMVYRLMERDLIPDVIPTLKRFNSSPHHNRIVGLLLNKIYKLHDKSS